MGGDRERIDLFGRLDCGHTSCPVFFWPSVRAR